MIDPDEPRLSIVRQCDLVRISRSSFYFEGKGESPLNLTLMRLIDEQFLRTPFYGSRVRRLMRKMGLMPIYQAPKTSTANPDHKVYPYLLRDLTIDRPNQVWCTDITYIPMRRGFLYLVAVMDWHSRKVLAWRLSNTMDVSFCIEALQEAFATYGTPTIFNTDQGSQFTSLAFTGALADAGVKISMDGKGRWMDNVFIERLWRSLKYECVYLHMPETGSQARTAIGDWINFYNTERPHSTFNGRTPHEAYNGLNIQPATPAAAQP